MQLEFSLLFYQVFNVHDYYLINLLINIPLTLLTFLDLIKRNNPNLLLNKNIKIIAAIFITFIIYDSALKTRIKYNGYTGYFQV